MPYDGETFKTVSLPITPKIDEDVRQVLVEARRKINRGWIQGQPVRMSITGRRYCILGALEASTTPEEVLLMQRSIMVLTDQLWPGRNAMYGGALMIFNDNPARSKSDVLKLFDRALQEK